MNIKATLVVLLLFLISLTMSGCINQKPETETRNIAPVSDIQQKTASGSGASWCEAGSSYSSKYGEISQETVVKGLTVIDGVEVCEIETTSNDVVTTQYTDKDSKYYYVVMKDKKTGKIISESKSKQ